MQPKTIIAMTRLTFLLFLSLLSLTSCQNDSENNDQIRATGSAGPARIPPQNEMTNALMQDYWVFEFFVVPNDEEGSQFNRGRWYNFHADGTFDGGHWQEQTDFGNWYYRVTPDKTFVLVDSEVNDLNDAEWEIQGSTYDYTAMSWVRTGKFGDQRQILGKLLRLTTTPTKASLGVE